MHGSMRHIGKLAAVAIVSFVSFIAANLIYTTWVVPALSGTLAVPVRWWAVCVLPIVVAGIGMGAVSRSAVESIRLSVAGILGMVFAYHVVIDGRVNDGYGPIFVLRTATAYFFGLLFLVICGFALRRLTGK